MITVTVLAAGLLLAVSALAVQPKSGCWGTCGGDRGPIDGYFGVSGGKIADGVEAEFRCLGLQKIPQPIGPPATEGDTLIVPRPVNSRSLPPSLKISKGGHFSFDGYGERLSGRKTSKIKVNLSGEFVSSTKARLTFHISYNNCGTQHLTVRRTG